MARRPQVDLAALRVRHPAHFAGFGRDRATTLAIAGGALALLVFGMIYLGFFGERVLNGLGELGKLVVLMLPPDPGGWSHLKLFTSALIETVAIALIGTLGAAAFGLPLGLLADDANQ